MKLLSDIGEKEALKIVLDCLDGMPGIPFSFGDDVSAIQLFDDKLAVLKTDMLVGRTDVPPGMTLEQAARKAIVMNISDFAAKGVKPIAILVALGLQRDSTKWDLKQISKGINRAARDYGAYVVGGDINESSDLVISCSLFGLCEQDVLVKRSGARPGDIVAVTGSFGKTAAGLKILLEGLRAPARLKKCLLKSVFIPEARLVEGEALARIGSLTSSIDSSDGLALSLYEISDASNVGFAIDNVPLAQEVIEFSKRHKLDPYKLGLYGGEEYELVVTVRPGLWEKSCEILSELGTSLIRIGKVISKKKIMLNLDGKKKFIERKGWEHFKS